MNGLVEQVVKMPALIPFFMIYKPLTNFCPKLRNADYLVFIVYPMPH